MSLAHGYDSDDGEPVSHVKNDIFGLASLQTTKKARVHDGDSTAIVLDAAPHVLEEVSS